MLFSRQLPLPRLIELCRVLRHNLAAGITLKTVFQQQAKRAHFQLRPLADRVALRLEQGESLIAALEHEPGRFPTLFLSLTRLGEETGHLPEIYTELEKYFSLQLKLRKQFRSKTLLPAIQFVLAIFVIAGLIMIMGMIARSAGGRPLFAPFGLTGPRGALVFLIFVFGGMGALYLAYRIVPGMLKQKAAIDGLLLRIPSLGPCLYAFVMSRFTMALQLTLDSGLAITKALRLSLNAAGNAAFAYQADEVVETLKNGEPLIDALSRTRLFNVDFLNIVAVGEESGRLPEVMRQQTDYWNEEAERKITVLTKLAAMAVWLVYAVFMIFLIFSIAQIYLNALAGAGR